MSTISRVLSAARWQRISLIIFKKSKILPSHTYATMSATSAPPATPNGKPAKPSPAQAITQNPIPKNAEGDNKAAYLMEEKGHWEVHPSEMYEPGDGEVLLRVHAIAVQQMEGFQQKLAIKKNISYPLVMGGLVAGEVVKVGPGCHKLTIGDRVTGGLNVWVSGGQRKYAGHQRYTLAFEFEMVRIPKGSKLSYADALASGYQSAAHAIYQVLKMDRPEVLPPQKPRPKNKKICIMGASGLMGALGITYSKLSGYEVIAVCSAHNFDLVKSRGADHVFDRHDPETPARIRELFPIDFYYDAVKEPDALKSLFQIITGDEATESTPASPALICTLVPVTMPGMPTVPEGINVEMLGFKNYLPEHAEYMEWLMGKDGLMETGLREGWLRGTNAEVIGGLDKLEAAVQEVWHARVSGKKLIIDPWID